MSKVFPYTIVCIPPLYRSKDADWEQGWYTTLEEAETAFQRDVDYTTKNNIKAKIVLYDEDGNTLKESNTLDEKENQCSNLLT